MKGKGMGGKGRGGEGEGVGRGGEDRAPYKCWNLGPQLPWGGAVA